MFWVTHLGLRCFFISDKAGLYARVSTQKQELKRQKSKLTEWAEQNGYDYDMYFEKVSSVSDRPEYEELISNLDFYDVVAVTKIDRFGRSLNDILNQIELIKSHGVDFVTIDQPINTNDELMGEVMTKLLALFSEFERKMIRRRMEAGWQEAYEDGCVGRPEKLGEHGKEIVVRRRKLGYSYSDIVTYMDRVEDKDISRSTIYRVLRERGLIDS